MRTDRFKPCKEKTARQYNNWKAKADKMQAVIRFFVENNLKEHV